MVKKYWVSLSAFSILFIVAFVSLLTTFYVIRSNNRCPGLTDAYYQPIVEVNEDWELNVTTDYFPNGCWTLRDPKIWFIDNNLELVIQICAIKSGEVCIQAFIQREAIINLTFPLVGNWSVLCNNVTFYVQVI